MQIWLYKQDYIHKKGSFFKVKQTDAENVLLQNAAGQVPHPQRILKKGYTYP